MANRNNPRGARTLIEDNIKEVGKKDIEDISFSIIDSRLPGYGGTECHRIEARVQDGHYVLMESDTIGDFNWESFGVVEMNNPNQVIKRMYEKAKEIAKEVAKQSQNSVLDLSSLAKQIPKKAYLYRD